MQRFFDPLPRSHYETDRELFETCKRLLKMSQALKGCWEQISVLQAGDVAFLIDDILHQYMNFGADLSGRVWWLEHGMPLLECVCASGPTRFRMRHRSVAFNTCRRGSCRLIAARGNRTEVALQSDAAVARSPPTSWPQLRRRFAYVVGHGQHVRVRIQRTTSTINSMAAFVRHWWMQLLRLRSPPAFAARPRDPSCWFRPSSVRGRRWQAAAAQPLRCPGR